MSLAQILSAYITLNALITAAYVSLKLLAFLWSKSKTPMSSSKELLLHYFILSTLFCLAVALPFFPKQNFIQPAAKVWSAHSIQSFSNDYRNLHKGGYLALPTPSGSKTFSAEKVSLSLLLFSILVLVAGVFRIARDLLNLRAIKRNSFVIRKIGQVSILSNDHTAVPFSYWVPGHAEVVVPSTLLAKPIDFKMAVAHELQHHRHGDTKWVYSIWALRTACALNPFIHLWNRWLSEIQEFACDETLVDQGKVDSRQYARCLVEVAQSALNQKYVPACATGLTFLVERNLLTRRVKKMISASNQKMKQSVRWSVALAVVALMMVAAFASQGVVQDRRVTMADAQRMAAKAKSESDFPIVINDKVLKQLNRFVGTPEGREYMRGALQRMETHRNMIENKIADYDVPLELLAVPVAESGYENRLSKGSSKAAGIWMFIASTARNFGLLVDDKTDERLDLVLETDAAMRYLKGEKKRFNDWQLALLSYNMGDKRVQQGIDKTGSRDAWTLIQNGFEGDKDYLPKIMASILIIKNPDSIN